MRRTAVVFGLFLAAALTIVAAALAGRGGRGASVDLVSTSNADDVFLEQDYTNNTAWVRFRLSSDSKGNRKVTATEHSPCATPGLCGENTTNR